MKKKLEVKVTKVLLKAKVILTTAEELDENEVMQIVLGAEQKLNLMQLHVKNKGKEIRVLPRFHFQLEQQ